MGSSMGDRLNRALDRALAAEALVKDALYAFDTRCNMDYCKGPHGDALTDGNNGLTPGLVTCAGCDVIAKAMALGLVQYTGHDRNNDHTNGVGYDLIDHSS